MAYGIKRNSTKIIKIIGNPRARHNQRGLIVWDSRKKGVESWVRKWGTPAQKKKFLK